MKSTFNKSNKKSGNKRRSVAAPAVVRSMRPIPPEWDPAVVDAVPMRRPRDPTCVIRRTFALATLQANTGDTVRAFYFALGNMPNASDFTNLFDSYTILEAVVTFTPYSTSCPSTAVASAYPGFIGSWIDTNDAALPANLQEGQQVESFQRNSCTQPFTRVVRPRSAVAAYSGAFTSYSSRYGAWIDTASPNVQFYGLKCVITGSTFATVSNIYEVEATVTMSFRSIK